MSTQKLRNLFYEGVVQEWVKTITSTIKEAIVKYLYLICWLKITKQTDF